MKKFLIGCGVLTGVGVLVLVGASFFAVRWVKHNAPDLDRLERYEDQMVEAHGEPADFVPPADGAYDLQRARTYLRVRDSLYDIATPLRERMQADAAEGRPEKKGVRKFLSGLKSGAAYLRDSFEYLADADSVLLDADMGRGEYIHWTGLLVRGGLSIHGADYLDFDRDKDDRDPLQALGVEFEEECRKVYLGQFDNLGVGTDAENDWVEFVQSERARVRREDGVWPFSDGHLPESARTIFTELESGLMRTAPVDAAGLTLDNVLGAQVEKDRGGVHVQFD